MKHGKKYVDAVKAYDQSKVYEPAEAIKIVLDNAKAKLAETKTAMGQYEEGMKLMAEAQLESASASVKWVSENDDVQAAIWANGKSVTDFAHDLDGLGVSYGELESHADGISTLATTWVGPYFWNNMTVAWDDLTCISWDCTVVNGDIPCYFEFGYFDMNGNVTESPNGHPLTGNVLEIVDGDNNYAMYASWYKS